MRKILRIENAAGVILAYLNNLESGTCHEIINGEFTINFVALIEPLKTEFLYDRNNIIVYNDDYFRVINLEELHNEDNMLTVAVTAEHISYDLILELRESFTEENRAAIYVMNEALSGTDFEFTGTDVTTTASIDLQGTEEEPLNVRNILFNIASIWGGELEYFRKQISLKQQLGQNRGVDFRFGKNLQEVKRIIDYTTDPATISYDVTVVQGSELEELGYFDLGDTVRVIDDALGIDHYSRIVDVEKDIITGINSNVVLGQPIADLNSSMNRMAQVIKTVEKKVAGTIDEHGNLIAEKLIGTLNTAVALIRNATSTVSYNATGIMAHDQPLESESTRIVMLTSEGIAIANAKNAEGDWIPRTTITGDGINADEINTGTLTAININGVAITGSSIKSDSADAEIKLDKGILSISKKSSSQKFNMNYRAGLPEGIEQSELEYYNEFKETNPDKPAENTITLNSENSHMGLEFGNGAVGIGSNWVKQLMYGGTTDWQTAWTTLYNEYYAEHTGDSQYNPPPTTAQGSKLIIDFAGDYWVYREEEDFGSGYIVPALILGNSYFNINPHYFNIDCIKTDIGGHLEVGGNFSVGGTKNCRIKTEKYGDLDYSAYETAEILLGDVGENEVVDGECIITLDEKLLACVNTDIPYQVFLTKYGPGDIWVAERNKNNFVVKGENVRFGWEIKAKRRQYENIRFGQPGKR